jgi:hypothetical protein
VGPSTKSIAVSICLASSLGFPSSITVNILAMWSYVFLFLFLRNRALRVELLSLCVCVYSISWQWNLKTWSNMSLTFMAGSVCSSIKRHVISGCLPLFDISNFCVQCPNPLDHYGYKRVTVLNKPFFFMRWNESKKENFLTPAIWLSHGTQFIYIR